jgi:hypothetical protein
VLVDTGQHDDDAMAASFRRDLGLPQPDWDLNVPALAQPAAGAAG